MLNLEYPKQNFKPLNYFLILCLLISLLFNVLLILKKNNIKAESSPLRGTWQAENITGSELTGTTLLTTESGILYLVMNETVIDKGICEEIDTENHIFHISDTNDQLSQLVFFQDKIVATTPTGILLTFHKTNDAVITSGAMGTLEGIR